MALSAIVLWVLLAMGAVKPREHVAMRLRARAAVPKRPPTYELIKRIESADAARALEVFRGDHGLFRFDEMKWIEPEVDDDHCYEDEGYGSLVTCSGLYGSAEAAERDARAEIPWLRETADA
jgi:hypothetical protein